MLLSHCEVLLQWQTLTLDDVDIGANPSAEGGDEDGPADDSGGRKVVDLVESFRLQVRSLQQHYLQRCTRQAVKDVDTACDLTNECCARRSNQPMTRSSSWHM